MSPSNWLYHLAVRVCLCALLLGPALNVSAQEGPRDAKPIERPSVDGKVNPGKGDQSPGQKNSPASDPPAATKSQIGAPVDPATADQKAADDDSQSKKEARDLQRRDVEAQESMSRAAWVAALLTFVGVLLIWRTLVYTRDAARAARDAVAEAREGTKAAQEAAAAANIQAEYARHSFEATQRAFIAYETMDMKPVEETGIYKFQPVIINAGGGLARNVLHFCTHAYTLGNSDPNFLIVDTYKKQLTTPISRGYIPAGKKIWLAEAYFGPADMPNPAIGRRLFVFGWVEYDDILPDSKRHRTEFCVEFIAEAAQNPQTGEITVWYTTRRHSRFNGIDEDCERPTMGFEERLNDFHEAQAAVRAQRQPNPSPSPPPPKKD